MCLVISIILIFVSFMFGALAGIVFCHRYMRKYYD